MKSSPAPFLIHSKLSAVVDFVGLVIGFVGLGLVALYGMGVSAYVAGDISLILVAGVVFWGFAVLMILIQESEAIPAPSPWSFLTNAWKRKRFWVLASCFGAVFIIVRSVSTNWAQLLDMDQTGKRIGVWFLFLLEPLIWALVTIILTEVLMGLCPLVVRQLRGWKRRPFDRWEEHNLRDIVEVSDFGPWEDPRATKMSVDKARAYAWLANRKADQCWILAQTLVLLAGAGLSTAFALWITTPSIVPQYAAGASLLVGTLGFRFLLTSVRTWKARAESYAAYIVEAQTLPIESPPIEVSWWRRLMK